MKDLAEVLCELMAERKKTAAQGRYIQKQKRQIQNLEISLHQQDRRINELLFQLSELTKDAPELGWALDKIERLEAELKTAQEEADRHKRSAKRQAHPFRRRKTKDPQDYKKPGRRKKEGKFANRETPKQADREEKTQLTQCTHCGNTELSGKKNFTNWQLDIPPVRPEIIRFETEGCVCPSCNQWTQSQHPEQLSTAMGAANITLGPKAIAMAADLHARHGLSYEKIASVFSELLNFEVTRSCLCKALNRLLSKAEPVYEELIENIRNACCVHADETGWRIGNLNAWLWVFTNQQTCIYTIRSGEGARGHGVILDILGTEFKGVLVSDCFIAYDQKKLDDWIKQKCFSHLLKAFGELSETEKAEALTFAMDAITFLKSAMSLADQRGDEDYEKLCQEMEHKLDNLLLANTQLQDEDAARLHNRLVKHRAHLLTFLYYDEVDADNNIAERDVRPGVISRKTQGCNKTENGARQHAVLASIIATCRKQSKGILKTLTDIQFGRVINFAPP